MPLFMLLNNRVLRDGLYILNSIRVCIVWVLILRKISIKSSSVSVVKMRLFRVLSSHILLALIATISITSRPCSSRSLIRPAVDCRQLSVTRFCVIWTTRQLYSISLSVSWICVVLALAFTAMTLERKGRAACVLCQRLRPPSFNCEMYLRRKRWAIVVRAFWSATR